MPRISLFFALIVVSYGNADQQLLHIGFLKYNSRSGHLNALTFSTKDLTSERDQLKLSPVPLEVESPPSPPTLEQFGFEIYHAPAVGPSDFILQPIQQGESSPVQGSTSGVYYINQQGTLVHRPGQLTGGVPASHPPLNFHEAPPAFPHLTEEELYILGQPVSSHLSPVEANSPPVAEHDYETGTSAMSSMNYQMNNPNGQPGAVQLSPSPPASFQAGFVPGLAYPQGPQYGSTVSSSFPTFPSSYPQVPQTAATVSPSVPGFPTVYPQGPQYGSTVSPSVPTFPPSYPQVTQTAATVSPSVPPFLPAYPQGPQTAAAVSPSVPTFPSSFPQGSQSATAVSPSAPDYPQSYPQVPQSGSTVSPPVPAFPPSYPQVTQSASAVPLPPKPVAIKPEGGLFIATVNRGPSPSSIFTCNQTHLLDSNALSSGEYTVGPFGYSCKSSHGIPSLANHILAVNSQSAILQPTFSSEPVSLPTVIPVKFA